MPAAGMVFMGGRRTGGYSLEDYCGTGLQMRTFPTLKCIMFNSLFKTAEKIRSDEDGKCGLIFGPRIHLSSALPVTKKSGPLP